MSKAFAQVEEEEAEQKMNMGGSRSLCSLLYGDISGNLDFDIERLLSLQSKGLRDRDRQRPDLEHMRLDFPPCVPRLEHLQYCSCFFFCYQLHPSNTYDRALGKIED